MQLNIKRGNSVRLVGKTALVTGASRNIGKEISLAFARQGADIALSALQNEDDLKEVSGQCQGLGVKTYSRLADLSDSNQCRELVDKSIEALGKIDILVCNAAVRPHHPLLTVTDEDWRRIFAINLDSSFYLTRSVIPNMIERQNGSIIAIGG
ncbi:MAG: SDR family NAD(P)-dependent oxidoreductase, partial [Chloroflexota bacterium]|nr:SDR family NAD(P)-dependent oxidoreductase [Chloroflexota bacterium]